VKNEGDWAIASSLSDDNFRDKLVMAIDETKKRVELAITPFGQRAFSAKTKLV
jgi:hypothetical protein